MKPIYPIIMIISAMCATIPLEAVAQENVDPQEVAQSMEVTSERSDRFARRAARRTARAERRMQRYERKLAKKEAKEAERKYDTKEERARRRAARTEHGKKKYRHTAGPQKETAQQPDVPDSVSVKSSSVRVNVKGLKPDAPPTGKEPSLDELANTYGFARRGVGVSDAGVKGSINRAREQLNVSKQSKKEMRRKAREWKEKAKNNPEYARLVKKMGKENYYHAAQISEYRKALRSSSAFEEAVTQTLRKDPRFADYLAVLPVAKTDPEKMQPKNLIKDMMQSQAAAVSPDASKLLSDAKGKSSELLGGMNKDAANLTGVENAEEVPDFEPNPYKTKSIPERIDIGIDLEFGNKTYFWPASGVLGLRLVYNFHPDFYSGLSGNYRFGMGEIKHIRFSHMGWGYGVFAGYVVWKGFGVQAAFERNYRTATSPTPELHYPAGWTSSLLLGITKEYRIGKKAKGSMAVYYDFLHNKHTPPSNAWVWRMGWKF